MSCPICKKPVVEKYKPFCSKRCADVDLGRWMNETYAIPSEEESSSEGDANPDAPAPNRPH